MHPTSVTFVAETETLKKYIKEKSEEQLPGIYNIYVPFT